MSDTSFEILLVEWLGPDSMSNTDETDQFATLLTIIGDISLSALAKSALCELLLHILNNEDHCRTLFLQDFSQADLFREDPNKVVVEMQTRLAVALHVCEYDTIPLNELLPAIDAEQFEWRIAGIHQPQRYMETMLRRVIDKGYDIDDRFTCAETIVLLAEQYAAATEHDADAWRSLAGLTGLAAFKDMVAGARKKLQGQFEAVM